MKDLIRKWYNIDAVRYAIVIQLIDRETVFLGDKRVRCIKADSLSVFNSVLKEFRFFDSINNIYFSIAKFDWNKINKIINSPYFSYNPKTRRKQQDKFNEQFEEAIIGYDFPLDFDAKECSMKQAKEECNIIKKLFDKYKVRYSLRCSGSGFHIYINQEDLPEDFRNINKIKEIATDIKDIFDLDTLDIGLNKDGVSDGSFYDLRRILKVPYSIDVKTGNVCLPLTDEQFNKFNYEIVKAENVLKNINLYNRGLIYRDGSKEGFNLFLKEELFYG